MRSRQLLVRSHGASISSSLRSKSTCSFNCTPQTLKASSSPRLLSTMAFSLAGVVERRLAGSSCFLVDYRC